MLDLWPAAADAKTAVGPAHNLHRFRQPVTQAVAHRSDLSSRRMRSSWPLSVGRATGSHVAGAGHQARSPAPNPCEYLYPSPVDGHAAHGLRGFARRLNAHHRPRPPESESETLVIHYPLKTRRERHVRAAWGWSSESSWLGARGRGRGDARVWRPWSDLEQLCMGVLCAWTPV